MIRYFRQWAKNTLTVDAMGYNGTWNATNQEANRAISEGLIGYFGTLDPTDRGSSYRYSLSSQFQHTEENNVTKVSAYVIDYAMDLYNDFTYFLENPGYGDQFHQKDRRIITGLKASETLFGKLLGGEMDNTFGLQIRNDNIAPVALFSTNEDGYVQTEVNDHVAQTNVAFYAQNRVQWVPKFRSVLGLRWDFFNWGVTANIPQNSGQHRREHRQPEGESDLRSVGQNRALHQRRIGVPQQRHPKRHRAHRSAVQHASNHGPATRAGDWRRGRTAHGHHSTPAERTDHLVPAPCL